MEMSEFILQIKIDHSKPVELDDLSASFRGISSIYSEFIKKNHSFAIGDVKLYLTEVNKGSIIASLTAIAAQGQLYLTDADIIIGFGKHIVNLINKLKQRESIDSYSLEEKKAVAEICTPITKDTSSSIKIEVKDGSTLNVFGGITMNLNSGEGAECV
jgi:hypothetical protein